MSRHFSTRRAKDALRKIASFFGNVGHLLQHGVNKHTIQNDAKARNTILLTFDFRAAVLV